MVQTKYPTQAVRISEPVHDRLLELQQQFENARRRPVPLGELIERLLENWEVNNRDGVSLMWDNKDILRETQVSTGADDPRHGTPIEPGYSDPRLGTPVERGYSRNEQGAVIQIREGEPRINLEDK